MGKIYGMHKLVGLQLFLSGTPTFSSGTPTFCQMGVLNSCFQNPSESSEGIANSRQKKRKRSTKEVPPWKGSVKAELLSERQQGSC